MLRRAKQTKRQIIESLNKRLEEQTKKGMIDMAAGLMGKKEGAGEKVATAAKGGGKVSEEFYENLRVLEIWTDPDEPVFENVGVTFRVYGLHMKKTNCRKKNNVK